MKCNDTARIKAALLVVTWMGHCALAGTIIYVDPQAPGANNGSSWADAYLCLQNALQTAQAGDEIYVAQGIYKPDRRTYPARTGSNRDIVASGNVDDSFVVPDGVAVRGGYAGHGRPNPDSRDIQAHPSILSGDLADDDADLRDLQWETVYDFVMDPALRGNSHSVVTLSHVSSQTVLDGFTITAGHCEGGSTGARSRSNSASVPLPQASTEGAGAFVNSGSPAFIRCTFHRNSVVSSAQRNTGGAAVATTNADATFLECAFEQNIAFGYGGNSYGGALLLCDGAPQLRNCTFKDNVTAGFDGVHAGGAVTNAYSDCEMTDCSFIGNQAIDSMGGAVYNVHYSHSMIIDCTFEDNLAQQGGAICMDESGDPNIIGCTFLANKAVNNGRGGAVYHGDSCYSTFRNCHFLGNTSDGQGGAMCVRGYPVVVNCLFSGNLAVRGAGVCIESDSSVYLLNCTFSKNAASESGGAFYSLLGPGNVHNCILWDNTPQETYRSAGPLNIYYSDVKGLGSAATSGNIDEDPRFQNPLGADGVAGTLDDDLHLSLGSPCLDGGNNASLVPSAMTDLDGLPRVAGESVDMGAYEFDGPYRYYVDAVNGDDSYGGWGPRVAFATIQRGIDMAENGYTVTVLPGVYTEEINFAGKAITVTGEQGGAILEAPDGYAVSFFTAERSGSVLKNVVIHNSEVGIFIAGARPTIRNVTLANNEFGITAYAGASPDISNCILWDNLDGDLFGCTATYSCIQQGVDGEGNIREDPLFADPENGDYHLLAEEGRFVPAYGLWSFDTKTSPCVDAGIPTLAPGDERMPNGGRINMGAFGGTPEASMSEWPLAADLNRDGRVEFADLAIFFDQWLEELPMASAAAPGSSSLQPDPPRWEIDGQPQETYGGGGAFDYYAEMTAATVTSPQGAVEYFFDCLESVAPEGFDSGWQSSCSYKVLVGRAGQGLRFRVQARDPVGNQTDWSTWVTAMRTN